MNPNGTSTSRACPTRCTEPHQDRARGVVLLPLLTIAITLLGGCAEGSFDATLDSGFKRIFSTRRTPQQHMLVAVSSNDPDARRDAVTKVADSKKYDQEWAIKGFIAIALLESDAQTRCVAIRALARTGDPRATETALQILNYRDQPPQKIRPPVALCRGDAAEALGTLSEHGQIPEQQRPAVLKALLDRLRLDSDRHVRIAAARGLAYCPEPAAVEALIDGLRDADFAVVHQCEESLVRLTGYTHDCSVLAWEQWLAAHRDDLFASAGRVPESRQPPYHTRWGKFSYESKEFFRWLWPGRKEE